MGLLMNFAIAVGLSALSQASPTLAKRAQPLVFLDYATYQGFAGTNGITHFYGMRYAAPPTGDFRWRAPQDPPTATGIQQATALPTVCVGTSQNTGQAPTGGVTNGEDCLYISVTKPSTTTSTSKLPVLLYFSGGGYAQLNSINYNFDNFIKQSGGQVIVAQFGYRVGALGFLAGSKVAADGVLNAGLLDQRKALKWVQKYIAKFGGDPDHVVLFGGSAGAGSVGLHLSAYGGRNDNLFVGAVGDAFFYPTVNNATYQEIQFDEFSSSLGCSSSPEQLACLRAVDINILQTANVPMQYPGQNLQAAYVWTPVVDGSFIVDNPLKLYQTGQFVKVPLISGDVTNEGTLFTPSNTSSNTDVIALVSANFPDLSASHLAKVSSLYPPTISHFSSAAAAYGDATFVCPGNAIAKYAGQFGNSSAVYKYLFNQPSTLTTIAGLGVPHNLDLGAIFGANVAPIYGPFDAVSAVNNAIQFGSFAPGAENAVSASIMQNYITSFVRFLDPNRLKIAVAPTWQPFATTRQTLVVANIGTNMYTVTNTTICDFWESVIPITRQ